MSSIRRGAAVVQRYIVSLYFIGVVVQFFLVGLGLFGMKAGSTIDNAKSLDAHRGFGFILIDFVGGLLLVATLVAWQTPARTESGSVHRVVSARCAAGGPCHLGLPSQVRRDVPPRKRSRPTWSLRRTRSSRLGRSTNKKDRARSSSRGGTSLEADGLAADNDESSEVVQLKRRSRRWSCNRKIGCASARECSLRKGRAPAGPAVRGSAEKPAPTGTARFAGADVAWTCSAALEIFEPRILAWPRIVAGHYCGGWDELH